MFTPEKMQSLGGGGMSILLRRQPPFSISLNALRFGALPDLFILVLILYDFKA